VRDQENDIWIWNFAARNLTRLTFGPATERYPVWTPDGKRIVFSSSRSGVYNLFARAADSTGTDERLSDSRTTQDPHSITPDGSLALLMHSQGISSLKLRDRAPNEEAQSLIQSSTAIQWLAEVSPNGRWLAYASNESGSFEVIVRPFPQVDNGRWQVSTTGGTKPLWARNGRELFYLDGTNSLIAVPVKTDVATFAFGTGTKILDAKYYYGAPPNRTFDVSADGQRFLMIKDAPTDSSQAPFAGLTVVVNWFEELNQRVGVRR
jgi:serine/threonine-protein kinase